MIDETNFGRLTRCTGDTDSSTDRYKGGGGVIVRTISSCKLIPYRIGLEALNVITGKNVLAPGKDPKDGMGYPNT